MCATQAGRNDRPSKTLATIDWMAYQGAPPGGVSDRVRIPDWWTGSTCRTINLPQVTELIYFFSTIGHLRSRTLCFLLGSR